MSQSSTDRLIFTHPEFRPSASVSLKSIWTRHPGLSRVSIVTPHRCSQSPLQRLRYHFSIEDGAGGIAGSMKCLGARAGGLADFAAEVGCEDFDGAAHFVEAGTHAGADAVGEGVFLYDFYALAAGQSWRGSYRESLVKIICGENGYTALA